MSPATTRGEFCVGMESIFEDDEAGASAPIPSLRPRLPISLVSICIRPRMQWFFRSTRSPHIQALKRAQGYLRLANGHAVMGVNHEYKRHGTTTLFAALNVLTGSVVGGHYHRHRRREFLDFMNGVVALYPERQLHLVLDNLNTHKLTHKPKHDAWLARHPNVHFHFTPTHASWLNQIECSFSILSRRALQGASFTSPRQLREAIDAFIQTYNQGAAPFEWTKHNVRSVHPKHNYADLRS